MCQHSQHLRGEDLSLNIHTRTLGLQKSHQILNNIDTIKYSIDGVIHSDATWHMGRNETRMRKHDEKFFPFKKKKKMLYLVSELSPKGPSVTFNPDLLGGDKTLEMQSSRVFRFLGTCPQGRLQDNSLSLHPGPDSSFVLPCTPSQAVLTQPGPAMGAN